MAYLIFAGQDIDNDDNEDSVEDEEEMYDDAAASTARQHSKQLHVEIEYEENAPSTSAMKIAR